MKSETQPYHSLLAVTQTKILVSCRFSFFNEPWKTFFLAIEQCCVFRYLKNSYQLFLVFEQEEVWHVLTLRCHLGLLSFKGFKDTFYFGYIFSIK